MIDRPARALAPLALVLALACGESERPTGTEAPATEPAADPRPETPPALQPDPRRDPEPDPGAPDPLLDALGDPALGDGEPEVAGAMPTPLADHPPAERGCALQSDAPIRVLAEAGPPAVLAHRDAYLVAAYDAQGVRVVRVRPGALPEPVASIALDPAPARNAPPALARTGDREVTIAAVDGRGRVLEATIDPSVPATAPLARVVTDTGADARFAPAVRAIGTRRAIAWTDGSSTPMHLRLAVLDAGRVVSTHDVTPVAGGGAAPIFLEGTDEPVLLFLDPRVGISVAHRVVLGSDGAPGTTEVQRPLNLAAEPPAIAAARVAGRTWLAYAAVGNMATRAVGLVDAAGTDSPSPLVPGLGYGESLSLDAVPAARSAVFAAEAPSAAPADAPHEVRVRRVDERGAGDPLVLAAPATDPALARRDDGLLAIAHRSGGAVLVHFARCAD